MINKDLKSQNYSKGEKAFLNYIGGETEANMIRLEQMKQGKHLDQEVQGLTILHLAAIAGIDEIINNYTSKEQINKLDVRGNTALHYACLKHKLSIIELLVDKGTDVDILNKNKLTPVKLLIAHDNDEKDLNAMRLILDKSKNPLELAEEALSSSNQDDKTFPSQQVQFLKQYISAKEAEIKENGKDSRSSQPENSTSTSSTWVGKANSTENNPKNMADNNSLGSGK